MSYQNRGSYQSKGRPDLLEGWLGQQPMFSEIGMSCVHPRDPEFQVIGENSCVITMATRETVKLVTRLKLVKGSNKEEVLENCVLLQRKDKNQTHFHLCFPSNGYYQFMIFALTERDRDENLPNVYNFLIDVDRINVSAEPFPKEYTKFYDEYCFLEEPLHLTRNSSNLRNVRFSLSVPGASDVWLAYGKEDLFRSEKSQESLMTEDLEKSGRDRQWQLSKGLDLTTLRGKLIIYANFNDPNKRSSALLEYTI